MLQQVEYEPAKFYAWYIKNIEENKSFQKVMHRQKLVYSMRAKLLLFASYFFALLLLGSNLLFLATNSSPLPTLLGVLSDIMFMPFILLIFLWVIAAIAYHLIVQPQLKQGI
jgi:uncharacterized membrane protein (DUF485 family)